MTPTSAIQRASELREQINYHNYRYYVLQSPAISDLQFDQLMSELRQLEQAYPELLTPDSPSQRVGGEVSEKFEKLPHPAPILSLANAFGSADAQAWFERIAKLDARVQTAEFVVEPKIDGLSVVLHYENGVFVRGATRGNGEVGEDITPNLRTLRNLPLRLPADPSVQIPIPSRLVVRGEAFISLQDFADMNARLATAGERTFINPRNTASGAIRQLDSRLTAARRLQVLCYQVVAIEGVQLHTQWQTIEYLRQLGFPVPNIARRFAQFADVLAFCEGMAEQRTALPYETDGMVIKLDDLQLQADLGFVGKDPRGALAYKYPTQEVVTRLLDVGVNVGRTGVLTPYAMLAAVEVGGVVVRQATLHNFDFIAEKDIRIGDSVLVKRAGEVIPYVIGPLPDLRTGAEQPYLPPTHCPVCGEAVKEVDDEVAVYCVNPACPAQLQRVVEHFAARGTLDIEGLGEKLAVQLVNAGLLHDVADIFSLTKAQLLTLEGFGDKKAENLLTAIETAKTRPLERLISALGIQGVGEVAARDLAQHFGSLGALSAASLADLQAIEGIGPNTATSIVDWFAMSGNQQVLAKLHKAGVNPQMARQSTSGTALQGKTFVITGTLPSLSREQAEALILQNGGKVTGSVSKNTHFLLAGEKAGSKLDKARALNVPILSEAELLAKIG